MARARITSKGQVTIPKEIRIKLEIDVGDTIDFVARDDGTVTIVPVSLQVEDLRGMLSDKTDEKATIDEMKAAIRKKAAERRR